MICLVQILLFVLWVGVVQKESPSKLLLTWHCQQMVPGHNCRLLMSLFSLLIRVNTKRIVHLTSLWPVVLHKQMHVLDFLGAPSGHPPPDCGKGHIHK